MKQFLYLTTLMCLVSVSVAAPQSSNSGSQTGSVTANSAEQSAGTRSENTEKFKKKPKKVWTNDEISSVGGEGSISVVGSSANSDTTMPSKEGSRTAANASSQREKQIAAYRDRLRQLNNQLEATDKQISNLRNFKADNTGASGGININHRYSMTPVEDQVKSLEEKKKQLQAQIDAIEDQARKNGVEPGQLR